MDIEEDEKFKDANGQSIDITIRGEREYDKCYFRVKDVSRGFKMPNLEKSILDDRYSYEINKHYNFFTTIYSVNHDKDDSKKEVYLTYKGMLKVLFCSKS